MGCVWEREVPAVSLSSLSILPLLPCFLALLPRSQSLWKPPEVVETHSWLRVERERFCSVQPQHSLARPGQELDATLTVPL